MSLLKQAFDIFKKASDTILFYAFRWCLKNKWHRSCRIIIKLGADVNMTLNNGETLLNNAINCHNISDVLFLIELGANIHDTDQKNCTPIEKELLKLAIIDYHNDIKNLKLITNVFNNTKFQVETLLKDWSFCLYKIILKIKSEIEFFLAKETIVDSIEEEIEVETIPDFYFAIKAQDKKTIELIEQNTNDMLEIETLGYDYLSDYRTYLKNYHFEIEGWSDSDTESSDDTDFSKEKKSPTTLHPRQI